jgi:RNA polymerase sigma-70 factor (ECF subfamily)
MNTLHQLVEDCKKGKRDAQHRLYRLYYGEMMGVCMRYCKTREEAAEVLNDAFLKVFSKIKDFNPDNSLQGWVRRVVVNTAIDYYRIQKRMQVTIVEIDYATEADTGEDIFSGLNANEIIEAIQQLPDSYRLVMNMYAIEGYSHAEIAAITGIAESTSRANLAKARNRLQQILSKKNNLYSINHYAG